MKARRVVAATVAGAALALAVTGTRTPPARVYLPVAPVRVYPTATPRPTLPPTPTPTRVTLRAVTSSALAIAVGIPGARVELDAGKVYRLDRPAQIATGVELDGGGIIAKPAGGWYLNGGATIVGHGLAIEADDVTVRGLRVQDTAGDAISVERSAGILLADLELVGPTGDGLLDVIHGPAAVQVRDVLLRDHRKCSLIGHQLDPRDADVRVDFERVRFERCRKRTPKVHRARVTLRAVQIRDWSEYAIDVQLGGLVELRGVIFEPGPKSWAGERGRWRESTGGEVVTR